MIAFCLSISAACLLAYNFYNVHYIELRVVIKEICQMPFTNHR